MNVGKPIYVALHVFFAKYLQAVISYDYSCRYPDEDKPVKYNWVWVG